MRSLAGKTALVTGAARGIGRAIALRLAGKGMRLALADRDVLGLAGARRDLERLGCETHTHACDLTDPYQVDHLIDELHDRWAGVDLLVNNAGVAHYGPTHDMTAEKTEALLAVNLTAPVRLTQGLLPAMLARPEAHVLNVCSILGLTPMPRVAAYCATKHALVGFSESIRAEYGRQGLGVTTLCPGFVRTELLVEAGETDTMRPPPALVCVTVDRVADAAVRGVECNRRRVVVDPVGRFVRGAMRLAPGFFDWMHALGRTRRIAKKQAEMDALHADPEEAVRLKLGLESAPSEVLGRPRLAA